MKKKILSTFICVSALGGNLTNIYAENDVTSSVQPANNPFFQKQGYLQPAPYGIDAEYSWTKPGGDGKNITFVDMENGWLLDHEDLVDKNIQLVPGSVNLLHQSGHGTSVLGIVVASDNTVGIVGTSPKATAMVASTTRDNGNGNMEDAIMQSTKVMQPGDVLLLEMQVNSTLGLAPIEYDVDKFNAIKQATDKGIIVVEAAANDGIDLDTLTNPEGKYIFNRNSPDFKDSGAIMVGAASSSLPHKRLYFSNFGSRVDTYAWGENVFTTKSLDDNSSLKDKYTNNFSGTSSASPIIAGAAVNLQGIAKKTLGRPLTPKEMRELLSDPTTATLSEDPANDRIGVMPNLKAIISKLENT
ncbi:hypothetical protein BK708_02875 [Bacillus thuringiensis serovar yunnanensis]|nr:hypothetical protein BK708_02875 [Bacillus thuringiensis serovar yunnanensis]